MHQPGPQLFGESERARGRAGVRVLTGRNPPKALFDDVLALVPSRVAFWGPSRGLPEILPPLDPQQAVHGAPVPERLLAWLGQEVSAGGQGAVDKVAGAWSGSLAGMAMQRLADKCAAAAAGKGLGGPGATGAPPLHSPAGGRDWPKGGMFGGMCDNVHGAVYANGESTRIAARRSGMG